MTVATLMEQINSAFRGSDDDVPAEGTADYTLWLNTVNRKLAEWANSGKNTWSSLFAPQSIGTVVLGTQTYDLDESVLLPANRVTITTTEGQEVYFKIIKPQEAELHVRAAYISGDNPKQITFVDEFVADSNLIGGTISMKAYVVPDDLTDGTDVVPVNDPYWLVYAVASELAFNDITYETKYDQLNVKANNLWNQMVTNNRRGTFNNPRVTPTSVIRIKGPTTGIRSY